MDALLASQVAKQIRIEIPDIEIFLSSEANGISSDANWLDTVIEKLNRATDFIVLITPHSEKSMWVAFEAGYFWGQKDKEHIYILRHPKAKIPSPLDVRQAKIVTSASELSSFLTTLCRRLDTEGTGLATFDEIVKTALENNYFSVEETKEINKLVRQLCSGNYDRADEALIELRSNKWLEYGALRNQNLKLLKNFHERLNWKELRFSQTDFSGSTILADLRDSGLDGAKFNKCILDWCWFDNANISNAIFSETSLKNAYFRNAKLVGSSFDDANLEDTHFENSQLVYCNFSGANMTSSILNGASLFGAIFDENTTLPDGTKWNSEVNLEIFGSNKFAPHG